MTDQPHFDTTRSRLRLAKRLAKEEGRRQTMLNAACLTQQRTQTLMRNLKNAVRLLDQSIEAELESVWIKDPSHFAFPMSARTMVARRDNLKATIAALSAEFMDRLPCSE